MEKPWRGGSGAIYDSQVLDATQTQRSCNDEASPELSSCQTTAELLDGAGVLPMSIHGNVPPKHKVLKGDHKVAGAHYLPRCVDICEATHKV